MSVTAPSVQLTAAGVVTPSIVSPLSQTIPVNVPMNFANVAALQVYTGSFTPANNQYTVFSGLTSSQAPNFLIVICDGQINLSSTNSIGGATDGVITAPIIKFSFLSLKRDATSYMNSLVIDGRLGDILPMPQGIAVNFTIIAGQADIS